MSQVPIPHERITYESKNVYIGGNIRFGAANVQSGPTVLDTSTTNGLKCTWSGEIVNNNSQINFTWKFEYDEAGNEDIDEIAGTIDVKFRRNQVSGMFQTGQNQNFTTVHTLVSLTEHCQTLTKLVEVPNQPGAVEVMYVYALVPWINPLQFSFDEMFLSSKKNDAVLVIGERKLHVNKAFLSYHSDYFRALFSSNFKEDKQDEIELKDVVYEDFGLLMTTIYPKTEFPSDRTAEKILEMADRFMVQSAIDHVEYHLLHNSRITNESMMWMADKYGMEKLMKKSILKMDSLEKAKKLKESPWFPSMSHDAKVIVLERLMNLI
ncbi:BTB domain-containing protein [Caenorhabditis elegans]|uniref:BTB domain-containing protein n=1 Tax=Caenorhabditis elegans TaxID=6239 RepID=Q8ITZ2_CAEEL|nr:BTB domain-containing protein [Caenorhabditis elegans]CCD68917.1 BTB domain-containing protein [Caenorhabditis elegans]|eukprot:NP_872000.1 BTB (Broad/complex/Tramtrack/Bric a brac) domain protein [Caenorhabditis elegans]